MMTQSTASTSKKPQGVWLIGGIDEAITGSKLPSNQQVMSRFFHLHTIDRKTIQKSASETAQEVVKFWEKARIPTRRSYHIINKIKQQHEKWQHLKKAASRRTATQMQNEEEFTTSLNDLFDVAHADAMQLIKIPEDKEFLTAQREKGRRGTMGPIDQKLTNLEMRRQKIMLAEKQERDREEGCVPDESICQNCEDSESSSLSQCDNTCGSSDEEF